MPVQLPSPNPPGGAVAPQPRHAVSGGGGGALAAWLLGRGPVPPAGQLRAAKLGAYACTVLPEDHPERAELRPDLLVSLTQHHHAKRQMFPLLRAWQEAGIQALLFKGFHLSEFVYPTPGARFYADVDVLLRPEQAPDARRVAEATGWGVEYDSVQGGQPRSHTAFELSSPRGDLFLDVHRYPVECLAPWTGLKRRVSDAVWRRARPRDWEGVQVWEMDPVDALLVGLVLGRAWGADEWGVKSHDAVDWRMLRDRCGVDPARLEARARELGCPRTLRLFRERCDPDHGRLELGRPSRAWLRRARALSATECLQLGTTLLRARAAPSVVGELAQALPYVWRAQRAVRGSPDLRHVLQSLTSPVDGSAARGSLNRRFRTQRGVRWAARVLRVSPGSRSLVRTLALYAALRDQGWPVSFVRGTGVEEGRQTSHDWLELDGRVLPDLREPSNAKVYRVEFRYP